MTVPASVFQTVRIGAETTKGVEADATRQLSASEVSVQPQTETKRYRSSGYRWNTISALAKDWVKATISGPVTYGEACYWLESGIRIAAPSGTTAFTRVYDMLTTAANTTRSYTVELGSAERAWLFTNGQVDSIGMRFTRDSVEWSNTTMIGAALQDGITLTASPTEVVNTPVLPTEVGIRLASTQAALGAASPLTDWISAEWSVSGIVTPFWSLNGSGGYDETVPAVPSGTVKFTAPANAAGMAELARIRSGATRFARISSVGTVIGAGPATFALTCDLALKFTAIDDLRDENGAFAVSYSAEITHDPTWGRGISITVVNDVSSLF